MRVEGGARLSAAEVLGATGEVLSLVPGGTDSDWSASIGARVSRCVSRPRRMISVDFFFDFDDTSQRSPPGCSPGYRCRAEVLRSLLRASPQCVGGTSRSRHLLQREGCLDHVAALSNAFGDKTRSRANAIVVGDSTHCIVPTAVSGYVRLMRTRGAIGPRASGWTNHPWHGIGRA